MPQEAHKLNDADLIELLKAEHMRMSKALTAATKEAKAAYKKGYSECFMSGLNHPL